MARISLINVVVDMPSDAGCSGQKRVLTNAHVYFANARNDMRLRQNALRSNAPCNPKTFS